MDKTSSGSSSSTTTISRHFINCISGDSDPSDYIHDNVINPTPGIENFHIIQSLIDNFDVSTINENNNYESTRNNINSDVPVSVTDPGDTAVVAMDTDQDETNDNNDDDNNAKDRDSIDINISTPGDVCITIADPDTNDNTQETSGNNPDIDDNTEHTPGNFIEINNNNIIDAGYEPETDPEPFNTEDDAEDNNNDETTVNIISNMIDTEYYEPLTDADPFNTEADAEDDNKIDINTYNNNTDLNNIYSLRKLTNNTNDFNYNGNQSHYTNCLQEIRSERSVLFNSNNLVDQIRDRILKENAMSIISRLPFCDAIWQIHLNDEENINNFTNLMNPITTLANKYNLSEYQLDVICTLIADISTKINYYVIDLSKYDFNLQTIKEYLLSESAYHSAAAITVIVKELLILIQNILRHSYQSSNHNQLQQLSEIPTPEQYPTPKGVPGGARNKNDKNSGKKGGGRSKKVSAHRDQHDPNDNISPGRKIRKKPKRKSQQQSNSDASDSIATSDADDVDNNNSINQHDGDNDSIHTSGLCYTYICIYICYKLYFVTYL